MTAWWYAKNDKKTGPLGLGELRELIQSGKIGLKTILWKEGMASWLPLDEIEELQALKSTVPPPLPPEISRDPLTYPLATRWPRFFSRVFDMWWENFLVSFVLSAVISRYSADFVEWLFYGRGTSQLFAILCLPVSLVLDATLYRLFGNTPGKFLFGLKVGRLDASPLSFSQYLGRNISMWVRGFALGFPLISLFTMGHQSSRLGKGLQASYDESADYRVRAKPTGWLRKSVAGVAFFILFLIMAVLYRTEQDSQREVMLSSVWGETYSWTNSVTGASAKINFRWKNSAQQNTDGQQIYVFTERAERAIIILGVEYAPSFTLHDYVQAFRNNPASTMRFKDGGRYFETSGKESWQGLGAITDIANNHMDVQVVKLGDAFWRVVTVQIIPYAYSDQLVTELQAALWGTIF
jgi:uncharacterized RDD family membrane protein YckC